jgi:hypothetical protein
MAGILDEVMDGITANEKTEQTAKQQTETKPAEASATKPATPEGNPMNTYHNQFKDKYGDKKK